MSQSDSSGKIQQLVEKTYGARIRLRVCGIVPNEEKILFVKNLGVGESGFLWAPPGGEVIFGERLEEALEREVMEETGVLAKTQRLLFITEFIKKPFHAVELFFLMEAKSYEIRIGKDPELKGKSGGIGDVKWLGFGELKSLPKGSKHGIFNKIESFEELLKMNGFIDILKP